MITKTTYGYSTALGALAGRMTRTLACAVFLVSVLLTSCSPEDGLAPDIQQQGLLNVPEAAPGDLVTITGINFGTDESAVAVYFEGTKARIASFDQNQLVAEVPAKATSGTVSVTVNSTRYTIESFFQIIINRIRPTYWIEQAGADIKIVRGIADLAGNTTKTVLYTSQTSIVNLSLEPISNTLYWVEQELDFSTFLTKSTIYRAIGSNFSAIDTVAANRQVISSLAVSLFDNKLYWTELPNGATQGTLFQADVNGQSISPLYTGSLLTNPASLKYEEVDNQLYFISNNRNVIKAAADSTGIAILYAGSSTRRFAGLTIDKASSRVFVSNLGLSGDESDLIQAGSLDGTVALSTLLTSAPGANNPVLNTSSLDVDRIGNYLYWLNSGTIGGADGTIYRMKLVGVAAPQRIFEGISLAGSVDVRGRKKTDEPIGSTISL
jgi:predicted small secreted protein